MAQTLQRTPLHDRHVALGGRLVAFAGWELPVEYEGIIQEHRAVRTDAGVFDVSHMGEIEVEGPRARELLQATLSNDLDRIEPGEAQYTLLTDERCGVLDDLIAYRLGEFHYLLIVNAANDEADHRWLKEREIPGSDVRSASHDYGLLAVQGPNALERLGLPPARPFTFVLGEIDEVEVLISRTGYTGEDGCELLCDMADTPRLWDGVLARGVVPCGLGARDTLRLEACLPLYGHELTTEVDPISAGLAWACTLGKEFTGVEALRRIEQEGPSRRLVPFLMEEKAIAREGMPIERGGEVTSGTYSPTLEVGIGMGFVPSPAARPGTELTIDVRGRPKRARVVPRPIYRREETV